MRITRYDIVRELSDIRSAILICVLAGSALLSGCVAKPPAYTITVRNEGSKQITGILLVSGDFGFKVKKLQPGAESDPIECNSELGETAKWTLLPTRGGISAEQKVPLKSAVGEKLTQANIVFVIGADGKATVKATPKE